MICGFNCIGLAQPVSDTITLKGFDVSADRNEPGFLIPVSADLQQSDRHISAVELLGRYSPVFVKSYSPGGTNGISIRGFASSQTLLCWNGFVLNEPTLGQASFNAFSADNMTSFTILAGTMAATEFAGGLASVLQLRQLCSADTTLNVNAFLSAASFSAITTQAGLGTNVGKARLELSFDRRSSENDYSFTNNANGSEPAVWPDEKRVSADFSGLSLKGSLRLPVGKHHAEIAWLASRQNGDVPTPITVAQIEGNEAQINNSFRVTARLPLLIHRKLSLQAGLFFSSDTFLYRNHALSISDGTASRVFAAQTEGVWLFGKSNHAEFRYYPQVLHVRSDNYQHSEMIMDQQIKTLWHRQMKWCETDVWLHAVHRSGKTLHWLPGFAWTSRFKEKSPFKFRLGLARNMRQPSFNDMFWVQGGNPDLLPEESLLADAGFLFRHVIKPSKPQRRGSRFPSLEIDAQVTPFYALTNNLIRWVPDTASSLWQAGNVSESQQYGAEITSRVRYKDLRMEWVLTANYARVFAFDMSAQDRLHLIYVPAHTGNATLSAGHRNISVGYRFQYIGKRFTDFDNLRYMPQIYLHDAWISYKWRMKRQWFVLTAQCINFLNANYQLVAWYPMPRRNYNVSINWRFGESNNKK